MEQRFRDTEVQTVHQSLTCFRTLLTEPHPPAFKAALRKWRFDKLLESVTPSRDRRVFPKTERIRHSLDKKNKGVEVFGKVFAAQTKGPEVSTSVHGKRFSELQVQ